MVSPQLGCRFQAAVTTVTSAGTRVNISANPDAIRRITFVALTGNTGTIYIGGSDVSSTVFGSALAPGESVPLSFDPDTVPLSDFWVDAATSGDKVSWMVGAVSASGQLAATHTHDSHTGILSVTEGGTGVDTLTDGGVLLGSGNNDITVMAVLADSEMIVGDGTTDPVPESGATLRTSIGVAIGTNVQAWDAFLDDIAALTDPGADRILFWDDSAGDIVFLTIGSRLTITDTTIAADAQASPLWKSYIHR